MELYFEKQTKKTERADHFSSVGPAKQYPCFKLVFNDNWNDYGFSTWFHLWYLKSSADKMSLGDIKIMHRDNNAFSHMPDSFNSLDESFCSLGMKMGLYKSLLDNFGKEGAKMVLGALQDSATNPLVKERYRDTPAFKQSLLREISAQQVLEDALFLIENEDPDKVYSIGYFFTPPYKKNCITEWKVKFDFDAPKYKRVVAIIGENGVGKTQMLSGMLKDLTDNNERAFSHKPLLKSILVLCSSEYDPYKSIKKEDETYTVRKLSVVQDEHVNEKLEESIAAIIKRGTFLLNGDMLRMDQHYMRLLLEQLGEDVKGLLIEESQEDVTKPPKVCLNKKLLHWLVEKFSTGQLQVFTLITHVCAYIHLNSLVVLDEPETHLHPKLVTDFFVCLGELLDVFSSYAIVPTHSPLVVRECVNRNVFLMKRTKENNVQIGIVPFRTFGQDITTLYENIFGYQEDKTFFYHVVKELSEKRHASYEKVIDQLVDDGVLLDSNSRFIIKGIFSAEVEIDT